MDTKSIIAVIVGVIVSGLILVAFVPVFTEVTSTTDTFTNTGNGQYAYISSEDTYTLEWTYTNPTKVTVNDVEVDAVPGNEMLAMGDLTIRVQPSSTGYAQLILADNETGVTANASAEDHLSISYSDGTLTASNKTTSKTVDVDGFYAIVPSNGTYTMKNTSATAYLNANEELLVMGITSVGAQWNTGYLLEGTITDYDVVQWTGVTTYTPTNITDDAVKISGYRDLYSIKAFSWVVDNEGTDQNVTYNYFLVPLEVTAEKEIHGDTAYNTAINLIPLVAGLGLLLGAVYYFISRR